jgi:5'-3' exonuclease
LSVEVANAATTSYIKSKLIVHLVDGTYELFRHFYGLRRFNKGVDRPYGAVVGVLQTVLQMIDPVKGSASRGPVPAGDSASRSQTGTYLGVATDHVIESFRNRLWADYKTGAGIERALLAQFHPLEEALAAMGVVVWPMIELEADDALASAPHLASKDKRVQKVAIWTPDKDLAQCVRGTRVVQIDGRRKTIRDAAGIREKFGVSPQLIPDLLALVGDAADGYPGIPGIGAKTAAQLLNRHGQIEDFPPDILGKQRKLALLFKKLATLRTDAPLFKKVETLRWRGATPGFAAWADRMEAPRLLERCDRVKLRHAVLRE